MNFFKKEIALSLLILLSVTVYSSPIDKNTVRKEGYNFFAEIPSVTFRPNSKGEASYSIADCTYTLSANSEVTSGAGTGTVTVTVTGEACAWTATKNANASWITLTSGQSGTGSGSVGYSYTANTTWSSRTGTITIAGQIFTFTQLGHPLTLDSYEPNNIVGEIAQASTFTPTFTDNADTVSISPASCHNSADIDIYKINLSPGYSYAISGALHNAYNQIDNSNYTLYGKVSYSTNGSDWTYWGNRQLSNKTMQGETFYLKIEPDSSGYVGTYAAKIDITRTIDCRPVLTPASSEVSSEAGTGQVIVTTNSLCISSSWTATTTTSWITLTSGLSGAGSGTVGYSYTANTAWSSREGTITIGGKPYTVTQLPPSLTPDSYEGTTGNNTAEHARSLSEPVFNNENASTISISNANCHNVDDVDIYQINLAAGYIYTIGGALYNQNNQTAGSSYTLRTRS